VSRAATLTGLHRVKVGDLVVVAGPNGTHRPRVTKVGRLLVHVGRDGKYRIEDGSDADTNAAGSWRAWHPDELEAHQRCNAMLDRLRGVFSYGARTALTEGQLERILAIVTEGTEPEPTPPSGKETDR